MDAEPWPTLGPGGLRLDRGDARARARRRPRQPVTLTDEERLFLYRATRSIPRGHELEGRRRFKRAVYSRRKGARKTELAAWIAIAEMDPRRRSAATGSGRTAAPGTPVGRPSLDPYIPMVATTEEQSEDLAYGAAKAILENCELGNFYDIGEERIMHRDAPGEMKALASAPSARDGARTSFQHFDETHLFISERLKNAHATMLRNIGKRIDADPVVARDVDDVRARRGVDRRGCRTSTRSRSRRQRRGSAAALRPPPGLRAHDLDTKRGLLAAIVEASGDALAWTTSRTVAASTARPPNRDEGRRTSSAATG
jgi:hypothetical protein